MRKKFFGKLSLRSAVLLTAFFAFSVSASAQFYMQDMKRDSARSDTRTGGRIERAELIPGEPDIKITINVPAFQMTLWQKGKEIKTYPIGVGMKEFPIIIGLREINTLIWNPSWIPPDSEWVAEGLRGTPIPPTDPRNPLGKMKIPLGYGYLLHQAKGPGDLGSLVSHGCVRVMRDDLYDLAEKIVAARRLAVTPAEIARAKRTKKTLVAELDAPVPVEITYDTMVVEGGRLYIYPDVYERRKNNLEILRAELKANGINEKEFGDDELEKMIRRARGKHKYVIDLEQIRSGNLLAGKTSPVVARPAAPRRAR